MKILFFRKSAVGLIVKAANIDKVIKPILALFYISVFPICSLFLTRLQQLISVLVWSV